VRAAYRTRQVVNALNLSTLLGLALGKASGARLQRGPDGLVLATGVRRRLLSASAFTVGNVVILAVDDPPDHLLQHEGRHASQWACCVVLFLPLYWLAAGWSYLRCGDHWSRNVFERRAGLLDGGYTEAPLRRVWVRRRVRAEEPPGQ
jgi:hypothetical protein